MVHSAVAVLKRAGFVRGGGGKRISFARGGGGGFILTAPRGAAAFPLGGGFAHGVKPRGAIRASALLEVPALDGGFLCA